MEYRHLGTSGLKVSAITYGNWITHGPPIAQGVLTGRYRPGEQPPASSRAHPAGQGLRVPARGPESRLGITSDLGAGAHPRRRHPEPADLQRAEHRVHG